MCYPLTITDNHSRYLLRCQALQSTSHDDAKKWMEQTFREYGLPEAIRSDNGIPFASIAADDISRLYIWWIQLGIRPQKIMTGLQQQNWRHERMHKTLKAETTKPPLRIINALNKNTLITFFTNTIMRVLMRH